jgi:hypothetical protein
MSRTPTTGWMILRPFLGLLACVGGILGCAFAITCVTGPLVKGPYEWLGNVIVGLAFIGILGFGYVGIRCKVSFVVNVRNWIFQWVSE